MLDGAAKRAFLLILTVWLSLQDRFNLSLGKDRLFLFFNCITWLSGLIGPIILFSDIGIYKIEFVGNYVTSNGCQSNFTFYVTQNGSKCLMDTTGANIFATYYLIMCFLVLATNFVFGMVFIRIFINWRKTKRRLLNVREQNSRALGFIVAANNQRNIVLSSIQYSAIGLIYTVTYLPISIYQVYIIYNGPPEEWQEVLLAVTIYRVITNNFTSVMNILFYGFFSRVFRGEMIRISLLLWAKVQQFRSELARKITNHGIQNETSTILDVTDYATDSD